MTRFFNTAGPCVPEDHYMLSPEQRLPGVRKLIDRKQYFVLHAPRQSGKTTSLLALAKALTQEGRYAAVLVSAERGQPFGNDPGSAEAAMLDGWRRTAENRLPAELHPPSWPTAPAGARVGAALEAWSKACPRPIVLFVDEIDALRDQALISVLRQVREGHAMRPGAFPSSVALVGLRDVRDYKVKSGGSEHLGTASPFNVKAESISLRDFAEDEVAELYGQHTAETGQSFRPEAIARAFYLTRGQPWLTNALAQICVDRFTDRAQAIEVSHLEWAQDQLIERQDTHLDSLVERLRERRVRTVLEPLLAGETPGWMPEDDIRFVEDLGLVRRVHGTLEVANPIYAEIIPSALSLVTRAYLPKIEVGWLDPDGHLDEPRLLEAFLDFWRQHGEPLLGTAPYHEIAPHLVLMAFLHRVANGGGRIEREYAAGSGRLDLLLEWQKQRLPIEVKVWRDGRPDPVPAGLSQLDNYLGRLGLEHGWLVVFDRRENAAPVEQRTQAAEETTPAGRIVIVIRA